MPTGLRLKGQECQARVTSNGALLATLTAIRSLTVTASVQALSEEYLGETTQRKDEIFNGMKGRAEFHLEDASALDLALQIIRRAQRRTPGEQIVINIVVTLTFPDGSRRRVLLTDVVFGELPLTIPSRKDYVTFGADFEAAAAYQISA